MKRKRILSLVLCAVMLFSLLSGCGQSSSDAPNAEEAHSEAYEKIHGILKDSEFYYLDETEALAPYYEQAAARKAAILNSLTEIVKADEFIPGETYTGTAYYISPNGDNENDGLSPETAWKTAERANWGDVHEGDAVFFERGGLYRLTQEAMKLISNVTYSAYGEGEKPVITLAQENSARPECWELYYEGNNGEKIWHYYQVIGDVGGIVFDDESYAKRVLEWPTPEGWLALDMPQMDPVNGVCAKGDPYSLWELVSTEEYRTVEENLTEDFAYICRVDLSDLTYPVDFGMEFRAGDLYLRCDAGNPGEHFSDIEVIALYQDEWGNTQASLMDGYDADGFVLDNLSLKYYMDHAVFSLPTHGHGAVIQNCTIEWGGNRLHQIESTEPTNHACLIGDGIYNVAYNATIKDNYMRHSANGCTFESSEELSEHMGTYTASGNLMENCAQGIRTYLYNEDEINRFDKLILRENIILNSGTGMNNGNFVNACAIELGDTDYQFAKFIEISDNVMIGSTQAMMRFPDGSRFDVDIHDNVFAQSRDGELLLECELDGLVWHMMADAK